MVALGMIFLFQPVKPTSGNFISMVRPEKAKLLGKLAAIF